MDDEDATPFQDENLDPLKNRDSNRSVYNLIYESDVDDVDNESLSSYNYLQEDDLPLPQITDSDSSQWSRFGQCCDCMDTCLRKRKRMPTFKCGWVKQAVYYLTLNVLIFLFFAFIMYMTQVNYYQDPESPPFKQLKFKNDQYPGLALVPSTLNSEILPESVIWYTMSGENSTTNLRAETYVSAISKLLHRHKRTCLTSRQCSLNTEDWGPCKEPPYGYEEKKPCILLKLNRLVLWEPQEYESRGSFPWDLPKELRSVIDVTKPSVWVHCKGETERDDANIGKITYYPGPFFNSSFFPIGDYEDNNPLIALRLEQLKPGYVVKLVCGLYAKNLHKHNAFYTYLFIKD